MYINAAKTKEVVVYFGKRFVMSEFPSLSISGSMIQRADCFKLLGVFLIVISHGSIMLTIF